MNMLGKRPVTAAEQALVDAFNDRRADLPGDRAVAAMREGFIEHIRANGLPTRRVEAWHYTDLRSLLKSVPRDGARTGTKTLPPLVAGSDVIATAGDVAGIAVDGARVRDYRESLRDGTAAQQLELRDDTDLIGRINGAFADGGVGLGIEAGASLARPLEIQTARGDGHAHGRLSVRIGDGACGTIVERHVATGKTGALVSSVTDLAVGDGAEIVWLIVREGGPADTCLGQIDVELGADARLTLFLAGFGGGLVRQEIHARASGEGSRLRLRGVGLLGGDSHTDVTMTLDHQVPGCVSTEVFRNVVFDRARGVFQGRIKVAEIAQKTDARMACNTLLLSDEGDFSAKPELEIFADDVQCGHGATIADIDAAQLFYMKSRGIPERKARAMLVKAFVAETVEELEDAALIEALDRRLDDWLETHG